MRQKSHRKGVGMDRFVKVGTKAELADLGGGRLVEVGGQKIAIFNLEAATIMSSRIRALTVAGLWQRAWSQATRSSAHGMVPGSTSKPVPS